MELNDFPPNLIKNTMNQVLNENKNTKAKKEVINEEERNKITLYLPYKKIISEKISKISSKYSDKVRHTKNKSLKNLKKAISRKKITIF